MTLTADRNTEYRDGELYSYPMTAGVAIYAGSLVGLDAAGNARAAAAAATTPIIIGSAVETVDNTGGGAAAKFVTVRQGCNKWTNSAVGVLSKANIGYMVYCEDDQTVSSVSAAQAAAGIMTDIDAVDGGIWVQTTVPTSMLTGLLAANNLSEVTALTARTNLSVNKVWLTLRCTDLVAADAVRYFITAPCAGDISKISSILGGHVLAVGDATLTGKIGGVAITTGVVTIAEAGSAIGIQDSCAPTANKTVAAGNVIELLVGGANTDTAAFADVLVEITRS